MFSPRRPCSGSSEGEVGVQCVLTAVSLSGQHDSSRSCRSPGSCSQTQSTTRPWFLLRGLGLWHVGLRKASVSLAWNAVLHVLIPFSASASVPGSGVQRCTCCPPPHGRPTPVPEPERGALAGALFQGRTSGSEGQRSPKTATVNPLLPLRCCCCRVSSIPWPALGDR